jgi:hypothetical protein
MRARVLVIALLGLSLAIVAGCGTSSRPRAVRPHHRAAVAPRPSPQPTLTIPDPPPTGVAASPTAIRVIKAWSTALREGDLASAASYFSLPSVFVNGVGSNGEMQGVTIHSHNEAEEVNRSLPCGATFISADQRGRYTNALFRLGGRAGPGGTNCGGETTTARTNFVIRDGKILDWIRALDDPGDNGTGTGPAPGGGTGTAPAPSGPGIGQGTPVA